MLLSLIIPCFNEQEVLPLFYKEIKKVLSVIDCEYELIFIDDGSKDATLELLQKISQWDDCVYYISFSRNFGKEAAIYAGFCNVCGDYVAVMDADMQDPPALLPKMCEILLREEYDCVAACRETRRGEPFVKSWMAEKFYKIMNAVSETDIHNGARDFRLMRRGMADEVVRMGEYNRFSKGIFGWLGFRTYWLSYDNVKRAAGKTKWNFWKLFQYALDGIVNFSQVPLSLASWFGILMTIVSFAAVIVIVVRKLVWADPVTGWASIVCMIVLNGGLQLFCVGIMGQYISKIYMEVKKRPHYIVAESNIKKERRNRAVYQKNAGGAKERQEYKTR